MFSIFDQAKGAPIDYIIIVAYFILIVGFGVWFGKYTKSTKDFFFGGQRFAWWLIAFSSIATTVGSYSFVKYSDAGFKYGLSSTQSYLNDWFWIPILLLVWLPILYYQKIQSVPEYFERRFGTPARIAAIALILVYLVGYVGINLYTVGQMLHGLLGWHIMFGAFVTACIVMIYMFAGGQTSVIMTDLAQGIILLIAGLGLFLAGVMHLGGFGSFWSVFPESHKFLFSEFNAPDKFSFVGIWGQDGLANTGAFVLMNQGMIMRFLAIRSMKDARKMTVAWILVLAPLAAIAVASGGWIAAALVETGELETTGKTAFVDAAHYLAAPGVFGFVLAALTAALMSTADTLVTAVSAIFINDIYRPYLKPGKADQHYLITARFTSTVTVLVGLLLVLVYMQKGSIYQAHGWFTAAVTPPIVVAIFFGVMWPRYNQTAALVTMVGGSICIAISMIPRPDEWPIIIPVIASWPGMDDILLKPLAFGMGDESYKFIRAIFGLLASGALGVIAGFLGKPQDFESIRGLVNGTQLDAMRAFKGGMENRRPGRKARLIVQVDDSLAGSENAIVPQQALEVMAADVGDLIYVNEPRWWFGGLRSVHLRAGEMAKDDALRISPEALEGAHFEPGQTVVVEKLL